MNTSKANRELAVTGEHRPNDDALLRASALTKRWQRLPEPVLDDLSFTVQPGTTVAIVGGNGVGKTTLMRILSGLILPDSGAVRLEGLDPESDRRRYQQRVGMLAAGDRGLYARLSVRRHMELWAGVAFVPKSERPARLASAVAAFGLEPIVDARVDRLSMGQRQRARLAMTFLHEPTLILLDEPLNSLDDAGAELLRSSIATAVTRGGACLWFSPGNDRPDIDFDHRWTLSKGKLSA